MEHLAGKILAAMKFLSPTPPPSLVSILLYRWKKLKPRDQFLPHTKHFILHIWRLHFRVWDMNLRCTLKPALTALPISEQWSCRRYSMSTRVPLLLLCSTWISWWIICSACTFSNRCAWGQFLWRRRIHYIFTLQLVLEQHICMSPSKQALLQEEVVFH